MTDTSSNRSKQANTPAPANVSIESVLAAKEKSLWQSLVSSQAFWVTIALLVICVLMSIREPRFATEDNFYNITRNFAFIGIMALGATAVIVTGGIDLSVGSIMGLVAVVCGLTLEGGYPWYAAVLAEAGHMKSDSRTHEIGANSGGIFGPPLTLRRLL